MHSLALLASLLCPTLTLLTIGYAAVCAGSPFGPCRTCHGAGRHRSRLGRIVRDCHRCDGTGRRIRYGRHLWNEIRAEYRNGTR
ncbi:hypothetical protein AB0J86_28170 [Micromonospora sp. NPDC049559]|uniref:hypothetical protein n=1 Tax=Micromonospora sp. NPDC049559 TaxID=3155923 RepID=UPI003422CB43